MSAADLTDIQAVTVILSTLAEMKDGGAPESVIYLAIGADLERSNRLLGAATRAGWIRISRSHYVTLTAEGRKLGDAINEQLAKKG